MTGWPWVSGHGGCVAEHERIRCPRSGRGDAPPEYKEDLLETVDQTPDEEDVA